MSDSTLPRADLVFTAAAVLEVGDDAGVRACCDVVVNEGVVVACGEGVALDWDARETIDGRDLFLLPGLCNAHTHSPESLARGLADCAPLGEWMQQVWCRLDSLDEEGVRLGVMLCAAEMLHGGVTAVVDHFRQTPASESAVTAAARAWIDTGMRATLAVMVRDRNVPPWVAQPMPAKAQVELLRRCIGQWDGAEDRLRLAAGPSAPTRCTDDLLRSLGRLCEQHGVALHMHVDETRAEFELAREQFGTSAVRHLGELGLLGPHASLAHCVWCDDDDLDRLAAHGAVVVHNPLSNLRLGSGRAPVERMRHRGLRITVGTDGAASNDAQNVLEAVKLAALLPRPFVDDPGDWITARQALSFATVDGAKAFGMGDGRLATGCRADFAAFDRASLPLAPANDPCCQFAFAGAGLRARHVVVDGRMVVRDHVIQSFDEQEVLDRAAKRQDIRVRT